MHGGKREGAGAPFKEVVRDKYYQVATTKDVRKELKDISKELSDLLTTENNKIFIDEILLKAMQQYKHSVIEKNIALIEQKLDKSYVVTNMQFEKNRMNNKLKKLIEVEKKKLRELNISYIDIYSFKNEFMIIKLNRLISLIKSAGNFKNLDDYFEYLDEEDYQNFREVKDD